MKNVRHELLNWIHLILLIIIWAGFLSILSVPFGLNVEALSKLPEVITIYLVLSWVFTKWLWRLPLFHSWLIPFPYLQGTWQGTLQTTWKNAAGETPGPIPLILVIKQTFDSISCVMFTQESTSYSNAAILSEDDSSGIKRISYNYTNTPDIIIRGRSAIHHDAAILQIVEEDSGLKLLDENLTSSTTTVNKS